jgi:hypothetical protein
MVDASTNVTDSAYAIDAAIIHISGVTTCIFRDGAYVGQL